MLAQYFENLAANQESPAIVDRSEDFFLLMSATVLGCQFKARECFMKEQKYGMFAYSNFGERDAVVSYYGSLKYGGLDRELQVAKRYREKYMEVAAESFLI